MRSSYAFVLGLILTGLFLGGCNGGGPGRYTLNIAMDPSLAQGGQYPTVEVDLFTTNDAASWQGKPIDAYFAAGGGDRGMARSMSKAKTFTLGGNKSSDMLAKKDWPVSWTGSNLVAIADLRWWNDRTDATGTRRRLVLPLSTSRWKTQVIEIRVLQNGLASNPEPLPEK